MKRKDNRHVWHLRSIPTDLARVFMWMSVGAFFFFSSFIFKRRCKQECFSRCFKNVSDSLGRCCCLSSSLFSLPPFDVKWPSLA